MNNDRYECQDWGIDGYPGEYVYGDDIYVDECYMDEKWKPLDSMGKYYVSNMGRVWSSASHQFVKPKPMDDHGHLGVSLSYNGKQYYYYIHRLMAKAFIPNPYNHPIVRHLNDIPDDNDDISNLAWGTQLDNHLDSVRNGNYKPFSNEAREKMLKMCRTPIIAIDLESGKKMRFISQAEAARILGLEQSNIWKVLNGERRHTCGYKFKYVNKRGDEIGDY